MSEVKVCVECKFSSWGDNNIFCTRALREDLDIVYGLSPVVDTRPARSIRADESSCGPEGKHFEAKAHPMMEANARVKQPVDQQTYEKHRRKVLGEMNRNIVLVGVGCASVFLLGSALLSILLK